MRRAAALALAVLLFPALAQAAWQPGGNPIGSGGGFTAIASGSSRAIVVWVRQNGSSGVEVRAQAWAADGDIEAGWPADGVLVSRAPGQDAYTYPVICDDGAGGAFVCWTAGNSPSQSIYVQSVSATGSVAAGWPADGLRFAVSSDYASGLVIAPDGAGGVLAGWGEYDYSYPSYDTRARILRIGADAAPVAGWPAGGHVIPGARDVGLLGIGSHVFVGTTEFNSESNQPFIRVRRLDGNAAPDPGWPQDGALLLQQYAAQLKLYPDTQGGVFADWIVPVVCVLPCGPYRLAARVRGDGTPDDGWIPARYAPSIAPDGTGGVLLSRQPNGHPGLVRVDAGGSPMPGWAPEGNAAMTEQTWIWELEVTGDGQGGAFVAWSDARSGASQLYASRLDAQGRLAAGWPATGSVVSKRGSEHDLHLVSLDTGVAVAVWAEGYSPGVTGYLTALRPGEPGPIADLRPVPGPVGFGVVQIRPNPARGPIVAIVELPNDGHARVDLIDAAGRVRESQDFDFPSARPLPPEAQQLQQARGAVHFNRSRDLSPGVYWLRVTQGARRSAKKLVVLE
jgi:hypothetical protein